MTEAELRALALETASLTQDLDDYGKIIPHTADSLIKASEKIYQFLTINRN